MKAKYLILSILSLAVSEKSIAELSNDMYGGVDGIYSTVKLQQASNFTALKSSFPSVNVFGGIHLNETVSLEVGFHFAKPSKTSVTSAERTLDTAGGLEHHAIHKGIAFSLDPYASLIVSSRVMQDKVQFFAGVGISHSTVRYSVRSIYINGVRREESHSLEKSRFIHKVTIGALYHLNEDFSIRITSFFKNTSKLNASNQKTEVKPKNSVHHGIGILYKF
jgi:opacity protein-like surface antigen